MQRYRNWSGTSGVRSFEIGPDFIVLAYKSGDPYLYTYGTAGKENVEEMKRLALRGSHLNAFINRTPAIRRGFIRITKDNQHQFAALLASAAKISQSVPQATLAQLEK